MHAHGHSHTNLPTDRTFVDESGQMFYQNAQQSNWITWASLPNDIVTYFSVITTLEGEVKEIQGKGGTMIVDGGNERLLKAYYP